MASQERAATYNALDADAIISSLDDTLYRFLSKPIPIHEHDVILELLLRIISGLAIPPWRTFDDLEGVLSLAGTWGVRGAVDVVRAHCADVPEGAAGGEEAELASKYALELSLHEEQYQEALQQIPARALVKLFKFHPKQCDEFRVGMLREGHVVCAGCGKVVVGEVWAALVWNMFWEMDARPSGERLCSLEVEEWEETGRCVGEKFGGCGRVVYERLDVLERVMRCLAEFPDTV
ncbi:hypothetical protein EDD18DRAFT_1109451 [Armillaria luteobubalina]|uniref:Uncharacterized protein n=1 Tax=Armillaria luteobubalina TaxID=153913 RepID=A0AA39UKJ4_9AGAR|nr:hypothetical protein EDD18DRAFT_1109451 [Armillaria luteobubalina]